MKTLRLSAGSGQYLSAADYASKLVAIWNGNAGAPLAGSVSGTCSATVTAIGPDIFIDLSGVTIVIRCQMAASMVVVSEVIGGTRVIEPPALANTTLGGLSLVVGDDFVAYWFSANNQEASFLCTVLPVSPSSDGVATSRVVIQNKQLEGAWNALGSKGYVADGSSTIKTGVAFRHAVVGIPSSNGVYNPASSSYVSAFSPVVVLDAANAVIQGARQYILAPTALGWSDRCVETGNTWVPVIIHGTSMTVLVKLS